MSEGEWIDAATQIPTAHGAYLAVVWHAGGRKKKGGFVVPVSYAYRVVVVDSECEGFVWLGNGGIAYPILQYWYTLPMPSLPNPAEGKRPDLVGSLWTLKLSKPWRKTFP